MMYRALTLLISCSLAWAAPAWADGIEFSGNCNTLSWTPNIEPDLGGYEVFDRTSLTSNATLALTVGIQSSVPCSALGLNSGQHYLSLRAFDLAGNRGLFTAEDAFVIIVDNQINDLAVTTINSTDMSLTFTEVNDGAGAPANYDMRFATPVISWGSALSVSSGTCSTPLAGTTIGAARTCTVTGLATTMPYQFQLVPYRGTLSIDAVFGPLSNIASGTTGSTPPSASRTSLFSDNFNRANGGLVPPWMHSYTGQQNATIVSNAVQPPTAGGAQTVEVYDASTANDQWGHITIPTFQGAGAGSVLVKLRNANTPALAGYECRANRNNATTSEIAYRTAGVGGSTTLASEGATTWATGDELDCEIQGSTIKLSRVHSGVTTVLLTASDSTYASGKTGFGLSSATLGDVIIDNFSMGVFSSRTTLFVDDFNRANGGLTMPWMHGYTGQQNATIVSNAVQPPTAGGSQTIEGYNAPTSNDQWAHIQIPTFQGTGTGSVFVKLRMADTPTLSMYECRANRNNATIKSEIARRLTGQPNLSLASENVTTWASGDELDCAIQGATITLSRVSGGVTTVLLTGSDATFASGKTGLGLAGAILGDVIVDNFSMGDFSSRATTSTESCGCDAP